MQSKNYIETFKKSFSDTKELSEIQRENLLRLLHFALVEMRSLSAMKQNQQSFDLADAFHNLPLWLNLEVFSFEHFRMYLNSYNQRHPEGIYDYLKLLDKINRNENLDGFNEN